MCPKNICVNLYQNQHGEIFAIVSYDKEGKTYDKLVENVEKFSLSHEGILECFLDGFSGFPDYDYLLFDGEGIDDVLIKRTEDEGYNHILHFESDSYYTEFYFEKMNNFTKSLFQNVKKIIDNKQAEYEQLVSDEFGRGERSQVF